MPRGGHNAIPSALRALTGNPGRRPLNQNEPRPPTGEPPMPAGLDRFGRAAWKRTAPMLARMGVLTQADGDVLALYCDAYSQWRRSSAALQRIEPTAPEFRKLAVTAEKARDQMRLLAGEFGLTPSSRSRMHITPQAEEDDGFEQFLRMRQ